MDALFAAELCELSERPDLLSSAAGNENSTLMGRQIVMNATSVVLTKDANVTVLVLYELSYKGGAGLDHVGIEDLAGLFCRFQSGPSPYYCWRFRRMGPAKDLRHSGRDANGSGIAHWTCGERDRISSENHISDSGATVAHIGTHTPVIQSDGSAFRRAVPSRWCRQSLGYHFGRFAPNAPQFFREKKEKETWQDFAGDKRHGKKRNTIGRLRAWPLLGHGA